MFCYSPTDCYVTCLLQEAICMDCLHQALLPSNRIINSHSIHLLSVLLLLLICMLHPIHLLLLWVSLYMYMMNHRRIECRSRASDILFSTISVYTYKNYRCRIQIPTVLMWYEPLPTPHLLHEAMYIHAKWLYSATNWCMHGKSLHV